MMDNYSEILIMLLSVWFGYTLNDIRRGLKEMKEQDKKQN